MTPAEAGFPLPPAVPTPHADRLRAALESVTDALDAAHADGLEISPVAAVSAANMNIVLMIIHGQELAAAGQDPRSAIQLPPGITAALAGVDRG